MNKYYKIKNIIFLIIIIITSNNLIISQNAEEAELLLNKVSENIKSYDNIYINYTYTLSNLEEDINQTNKDLNHDIETIFIIGPSNLSHISSSIIRDIIKNGGDVSQFLPKEIDL